MKLFDELITKTYSLLPTSGGKDITSLPDVSNYIGRKNELILGKELAYELGGNSLPCVVYNLYTEDSNLVDKDEVIIYGKDIHELKKDTAFARISVILTDNIDQEGEQEAYNILEKIGLRRYDVSADGFMVRTSVLSNREQVRVSKTAIKNKLSFAHVGKMYIDAFKKNPHVKAVKMIFVTLPDVDYFQFDHIGNLSINLFRALNHAITDLKMDCHHCQWKVVCDEVEGMKEMHQQMINKQSK